jgi:hypothetical protein
VLSRSFPPAIVITDSLTRGGAGVVAAARLRRWSAAQFEAAWTNAALLARAAQSHSVDPLVHSVQIGRGWLTDLDLIASIRVTCRPSSRTGRAARDCSERARHGPSAATAWPWVWGMRDNARPATVLVIVIAVFVAACNAILGPSQPDRNWISHDSSRFTLHARPGSFAAEQAGYLAEVLEDQYDTGLRMVGAQYGGRISGFLFASAAEPDREFDRTGTAYPATESFAAVCVPPLDDGLLGLLAHEANHVVIENALGRPGTSFMSEGLASAVLSERYHRA